MSEMLVCSGVVTQLQDGAPYCSTGWMTQLSSVPFDITQIDPLIATAMFTGGFVLSITPWATALGFSYLLKLIR